ncbi:sugar phosphate isomerase/epimerase family protein [Actinopolymorpha alba]|uniref:sugar phosphate isomerase/epimerase family protein n=1 Tax=Actinopolymorpha alba TaxID=533267 RepID=UPI00035F23B0|nr:sugar phosphate isomerase/epimerase [Actinopolymorpha alba]
MQTVLFTKLFEDRPVGEIADTAADLGFDGIDLLIRPGFTVDPESADQIAQAADRLRNNGLSVPMATTDLADPAAFPADKVLGACADAGIELVRLGYWKYDGTRPYASVKDEAREHLAQLVDLAARHGVRLAIQLHGGTIHSSGALTRALLDGHLPAQLGAYPDPGNQAVQDGREDWRLTFDLLGPWLACVGVKNGGWFAGETADSGQRGWRSDWLGLADGMVPWPDILAYLNGIEYAGPLSLHSHYHLPYPQVLDQTRTDLRYVKRLLTAGSSASVQAAEVVS